MDARAKRILEQRLADGDLTEGQYHAIVAGLRDEVPLPIEATSAVSAQSEQTLKQRYKAAVGERSRIYYLVKLGSSTQRGAE
jgi:hypothetical protein